MATLRLGEVVLDAIKTKLAAGLAARVAEINLEKSDTVTILAVPATDIYVGGATTLPRAPCIVVFQMPTDGEHEAEGSHSFVWVADIGVAVVDEDVDRGNLARKLLRQVRAVTEVLWDDDPMERLTGSAHHLKFIRDDPGPVQDPASEDAAWRAMHLVIFRAWQLEG